MLSSSSTSASFLWSPTASAATSLVHFHPESESLFLVGCIYPCVPCGHNVYPAQQIGSESVIKCIYTSTFIRLSPIHCSLITKMLLNARCEGVHELRIIYIHDTTHVLLASDPQTVAGLCQIHTHTRTHRLILSIFYKIEAFGPHWY